MEHGEGEDEREDEDEDEDEDDAIDLDDVLDDVDIHEVTLDDRDEGSYRIEGDPQRDGKQARPSDRRTPPPPPHDRS